MASSCQLPPRRGGTERLLCGGRRDQSPGYAYIPTYLLGMRPQLLQPQAGPRLASLTPYFHVLPRSIYSEPFPLHFLRPQDRWRCGRSQGEGKRGRKRTLTNAAGLVLRLPQAPSTAGPAAHPGLGSPGNHQREPCLLQGHPGPRKLRQAAW